MPTLTLSLILINKTVYWYHKAGLNDYGRNASPASLHNLTLLQYKDLISMNYGRQSMCHHNGGPVGTHSVQSSLDVPLCLCVQCACSFIKQHNTRRFKQCASNSHTLLLAPTQLQSSFSHLINNDSNCTVQDLSSKLQNWQLLNWPRFVFPVGLLPCLQ